MRMSLPASARTPCRAGLQVFLTELALYSSSHRLRIEGGLVLYIRCNGALLQPCCLLSGCTLAAGVDSGTGSVRCCVPKTASSNAAYLCHAFALLGRRYPWTWEAEDMGLTHLCNPATSQRVRNWLDAYSTYAVDGLGYMSSPPRRH